VAPSNATDFRHFLLGTLRAVSAIMRNSNCLSVFSLSLAALVLALTVSACDKSKSPDIDSAQEAPSSETKVAAAAIEAKVKVTEEGSKFDPPVNSSQIPLGAWMCEMGGVHFASLSPGDGKCPTCGMKLKQKEASDQKGHEGHEGHEGHKEGNDVHKK